MEWIDDRSGVGKERYAVRAVRGMVRDLSDHHVLYKVRLVGAWIRRIMRIRSGKLMEHHYIGYAAICAGCEGGERDGT